MNSIQRYICLGIVCMAIWHTVVFFASPGGSGRRGMGGYERDFNLDSLGYEDDYFIGRKVLTATSPFSPSSCICVCTVDLLHVLRVPKAFGTVLKRYEEMTQRTTLALIFSSVRKQAADTLGFEWSPTLERDVVRCRNLEKLTEWKGRDMPLRASEQALFDSLGASLPDASLESSRSCGVLLARACRHQHAHQRGSAQAVCPRVILACIVSCMHDATFSHEVARAGACVLLSVCACAGAHR